jgi:hypothetical protein
MNKATFILLVTLGFCLVSYTCAQDCEGEWCAGGTICCPQVCCTGPEARVCCSGPSTNLNLRVQDVTRNNTVSPDAVLEALCALIKTLPSNEWKELANLLCKPHSSPNPRLLANHLNPVPFTGGFGDLRGYENNDFRRFNSPVPAANNHFKLLNRRHER